MTANKRVMIVEDEGVTAMSIQKNIEAMGFEVTSMEVTGEGAIDKAASDMPDLILMDIALQGDMDGIEAAGEIRSRFNIPVIYITAHSDKVIMDRMKKTEPFGYIVKPFYENELRIAVDLALYKHKMEIILRENEEKFRQLAENISEVFWIVSPDWKEVIYISPAYENIWGLSCSSLMDDPGSWMDSIFEDDIESVAADIVKKSSGDFSDPAFPEYRIVRSDGTIRWISARAYPVRDRQGEIYRITGIAEDITNRKEAEMEQERLIVELREALAKVKTLRGMLPICASCKKIRNDKGYWQQVSDYISEHADVEFTHGICPDCVKKIYPDYFDKGR